MQYVSSKNQQIYYITVATLPNKVLECIKSKVATNGEKIHILAQEENRRIGWESHQNFGIKIREVANFLKLETLQPFDIVVFTDAYDVVYYGNQTELAEKFKSFNKPIIFGSETYCNPDPYLATKYPNSGEEHEFPFLNSGMFIGYIWALQYCLRDYVFEDKDDDQRFWTHAYFKNTDLIGLDYENKMFLNTFGMETSQFKVSNGRASYKRVECRPIFVHVNGPDKSLIDELV